MDKILNDEEMSILWELETKTGVEITETTDMTDLLRGIISQVMEEVEEDE